MLAVPCALRVITWYGALMSATKVKYEKKITLHIKMSCIVVHHSALFTSKKRVQEYISHGKRPALISLLQSDCYHFQAFGKKNILQK